jgi:hypothetical protein
MSGGSLSMGGGTLGMALGMALDTALDMVLDTVLNTATAQRLIDEASDGEDFRDGHRAFAGKRLPRFHGLRAMASQAV